MCQKSRELRNTVRYLMSFLLLLFYITVKHKAIIFITEKKYIQIIFCLKKMFVAGLTTHFFPCSFGNT